MVKAIPEGYNSLTQYFIVDNVESFINFLTNAFEAELLYSMKMPDGRIGHSEMRIGNSRIMMAEACEKWPATKVATYLYTDKIDEFFANAISCGATEEMPLQNQFYGDKTGGVKDPFGNLWWLGMHVEDVSPDELKKRSDELYKKTQKKTIN